MDQSPPVRDRRQRRRFLTLRNIGWTALAVILVFIGVSLWNEFRPESEDDSALMKSRRQPIENQIVREAKPYVETGEVGEHDPREPLWVEHPNQEDILGVDPYQQYRKQNEAPSSTTDRDPVLSNRGTGEPFLGQRGEEGERSRIKITGSGSDVRIEKPDEPDDDE